MLQLSKLSGSSCPPRRRRAPEAQALIWTRSHPECSLTVDDVGHQPLAGVPGRGDARLKFELIRSNALDVTADGIEHVDRAINRIAQECVARLCDVPEHQMRTDQPLPVAEHLVAGMSRGCEIVSIVH